MKLPFFSQPFSRCNIFTSAVYPKINEENLRSLFSYFCRGLANGVMGELQATLDVQVELGKFYNVDLFQRG